jgi:hypothetical protein
MGTPVTAGHIQTPAGLEILAPQSHNFPIPEPGTPGGGQADPEGGTTRAAPLTPEQEAERQQNDQTRQS